MAESKMSEESDSGKLERPSSSATTDQITSRSRSSFPNQQAHSKLIQLPQEIRDEIYANIFCSTRFAFGKRASSRLHSRYILPSARGTALAILRTCRRVRHEIGATWLHQVLFHFEDPESLLDKLAGIPITLREQIRRVRVSGDPLMILLEDTDVYYRTAQVLKLLPGLKVDTLTILADKKSQVSYETLNMLICYSDGWKELRYLSHNSKFLAYKNNKSSFDPTDLMLNPYLRQPQPSDWQRALDLRDGQGSHPSVVVYRATDVAPPGAILQPSARNVFTQAFTANQDARTYGKFEDATLMRRLELRKEVLVIVRRGAGVDYAERERALRTFHLATFARSFLAKLGRTSKPNRKPGAGQRTSLMMTMMMTMTACAPIL